MQVVKQVLQGRRVTLEPLGRNHLEGLASAILDGELWTLSVTRIPHPDELEGFLEMAEARHAAGQDLAFATIDSESGRVVGSTRFQNIHASHLRLEIGFTFIARSWQRTHINTEAKYLMLRHAFEAWHCNRVELLTDVLNSRSRQAIGRLGAREEGVLRSHMIMRDGRIRDSALYSVVKAEWPAVRASLEDRIARPAGPTGA